MLFAEDLQVRAHSISIIHPPPFLTNHIGGYTVLVTLTKAGQPFAAGASSFGIADLQKLGEFTHKFESGYLFRLLGVSADDKTAVEKVCKERSPLTHADKIEAPLLVT